MKAASLKNSLIKILLICSTGAVLSSCQNLPKDFPTPPRPTLKQTIYDLKICDKNGENCTRRTYCGFWRIDDKGQWVKIGEGAIKNSDPLYSCHGSFGLSSKEINQFQEWLKRVDDWRKRSCGPTNN